jgi:glycosyltransferase involved in cell wall biosynthesis
MSGLDIVVWSDGSLTFGAGQQALLSALGLAERGHRVTLVHRGGHHEVQLPPGIEEVALAPDDLWGAAPRSLHDTTEVADALSGRTFDAVLLQDTCSLANLALKRWLISNQKRWVAVQQGSQIPPALDRNYWRSCAAEALSGASAVVAVSESIRADLLAALRLPGEVAVIPNGRPPEFFAVRSASDRALARDALDITDDQLMVLVLARVEEPKGTVVLARALELLAPTALWPRLRVMWAGDGNQRKRLDAVARLRGWGPQLNLLGVRSDVTALLNAADVLLHATYAEGMPLAVIEAMAAGVPVVGSDIAAMREVLGDTGLFAYSPTADRGRCAHDVFQHLQWLDEHPADRTALGQRGAVRARTLYRSDTMVERYEEALINVLR